MNDYSCTEKTMEGPGKRFDARYYAAYTVRKTKWRLDVNCAQDHAWQAKDCEWSVTTSNR
jgi:hypothetical protein